MGCQCGGLYLTLLVVFLLPSVVPVYGATNTSFSGKQYIEYSISNRPEESRKDKVTFRFKTLEAFGVMLYSCGLQGDFLLLEMKRGKLVYSGSFGSLDDESGIHTIVHDNQYNDDKWHHVTLLRESGRIDLTVDGNTHSKTPDGDFEQLNLDTSLFVGGLGQNQQLDTTCNNNRGKRNFSGCLDDVKFNSMGLLYGALENFTGYTRHGHISFNCRQEKMEVFAFNTEKSAMEVRRNILVKNEFLVSTKMRTFEPDGHIFRHKTTDGDIILDLIGGKLKLTLSFHLLANNDAVELRSDVKLDDGDWHDIEISVKRNESLVALNVDKELKTYKFESHFKLPTQLGLFSHSIYFGGNTPKLPSLVACFRTLKVDGKRVASNTGSIMKKHIVNSTCKIQDLCFPSPCLHKSKCSQSRGEVTCDCSGTEYNGPYCGTCNYMRTCSELKASGETKSGVYKICPRNERIFRVHCDMDSGAAVIKHGLQNNTNINKAEVLGGGSMVFYYHTLNYDANSDAISDLLGESLRCEQYIRLDCYNSGLLFDVRHKRVTDFKGARWVSGDGVIEHYWGGGTPNSRRCGCAMDGTCAKDSNGNINDCNCDVGDKTWRFDAGMLTDKQALPVIAVQFSKGPEMDVKSFFSVGFLKCYGTIPKPTTETPLTTTMATVVNVKPTMIDGRMFVNTSDGLLPYNGTVPPPNIVVEGVSSEPVDAIFSKPWLVTIVVIGAFLCLLLVFFVFLLFRNNIYNMFLKCIYGDKVNKPRVEIEDYNRYSTATEEESDWDIYRLSTTFPTSTPEPSYGPTDDEGITMRVRTLEDLRGKRRFQRLTGWGSRTASAPTVVGSSSKRSLPNMDDDQDSLCLPNLEIKQPPSERSSKMAEHFHQYDHVNTEPAYSTTATDGECDSVIDDSYSEFSHKSSGHSHASSMKESECSTSPLNSELSNNLQQLERAKQLSSTIENQSKMNPVPLAVHSKMNNGTAKVYTADQVKAFYPVLPVNGYRQPTVRRAHPIEYGAHVAMVNNNGVRCPRLVALNRRPSNGGSDSYQSVTKHPTIDERDEFSDDEIITYENQRNSDGFFELVEHGEHAGSPSSETRLLFDDVSTREECVREADEQIKLLKKKVIEKATSADECGV